MRNGCLIVDARARPPTQEFLRYFTPEHVAFFGRRLGMPVPPASYGRASVDEFLQEAGRAGIDRMVIVNRVVPAAGGSPRGDVSNEHVAELVAAYPDRFTGVAGIDVGGDFGDPVGETVRSVRTLGMRGIHISPTRSALGARADDRRIYPVYEACEELGVPVFVMTGPFAGPSIEDTHPKYIQQAALDFPNVQFVCGHACWPFAAEMIGVAYRHENVHLSPDAYLYMPGGELYFQAANSFLADQFIYGSAYPVRELEASLDAFLKLGWRPDVLPKVLGRNAARLLGLNG